jgi:serine/threonine-protein kinase
VVETLGRYQIIKHLADGGMAELLLARSGGIEGFERHVVVKRIRVERARDQNVINMFLDEARLAASLHHANIVQVHDIGHEKGEYFFAMEYVHGEDLRRLLNHLAKKGEQLPLEHVLSVIMAAAAALHYAHEHKSKDGKPLGIVHRDVSPANVLVAYDGNVKVVDFGIAKAAVRSSDTQVGTLKGKISYMAPEQCMGQPIDRRSDVFALGIVLYELYTVRRLFKGESDFLTMAAIVQGNIPKPSEARPDIPPALEQIIMKALAMAPGDRYQTADEMRLALKQLAADLKLQASSTELADYMLKQFGRRPEPWNLEDEDAEIEVVPVDFDGAAKGMAEIPSRAVAAAQVKAPEGSLLARARRKLSFALGVPIMDPAKAAAPAGETPHEKMPTNTSTKTPMAWSPAPEATPAPKKKALLAAAIAVPVAIVGIVLATRGGGDGDAADKAAAPVAPVAAPAPAPTPEPAPAPAPAAAPDPAPTPTPPAAPDKPAPTAAKPGAKPAAKPAGQIAGKPTPTKPTPPGAKKPKPAYDPHSLFIKK